ncbi:MAG: PepSY domain-containing protein [Lautropia sp.]|nr:PepSY domain-containing protein [Lautropia sp.]
MAKLLKFAALSAVMAMTTPALADSDLAEIQATKDAQVSLVQAIQTAEKEHNGRAMQGEIEAKRRSDRTEIFYEVKVLAGDGKVFDVIVDARSGKVISSREDIYD